MSTDDIKREAEERVARMRQRMDALGDDGIDLIFREARTHNAWQQKEVSEQTLRAVYDVAKYGPTSANCLPMRVVFAHTAEGKRRLQAHVFDNNKSKVLAAPVTAIIAYDTQFYTEMPRMFPFAPKMGDGFAKNKEMAYTYAMRNGSLQGAYFLIAARAFGLDTGPMSGFSNSGVDAEFFSGTAVRSNFLCSLGYGDVSGVWPRGPRFTFDEICTIV